MAGRKMRFIACPEYDVAKWSDASMLAWIGEAV